MSAQPPALPPELDPRGPRRTSSRGTGASIVTALLAVMSIGVLLVSGLGYVGVVHYLGKVKHEDVGTAKPTNPINDSAQNFLVVGSDNRAGLTKAQIRRLHVGNGTAQNGAGQRSDTMLIVHISKARNEVTVVSLPRDSLVTVPRWKDAAGTWHAASLQKLNAAFSFGGAPLAIKTIELATGVTINHYVEISFAGFVKMVDAVGTVTVCSPTAVRDKDSGLKLKKGQNVLNSTRAMAYVRARHAFATQDLARIDHQQQFLAALFRAATAKRILLNPLALNNFLGAALGSVTVDSHLSKSSLLALAIRLRAVAAGGLQFITVPIADNNFNAPGLGSTVKWNTVKAHLLFSRIQADEAINPGDIKASSSPSGSSSGSSSGRAVTASVPPGQVSVQVLNGTTTTGLARQASDAMAAVGFAMGTPGNNTTTNVKQTEIHYDPTFPEPVKTVQLALPGAKLVPAAGSGKTITVVLGTDYKNVVKPVITAKPSASTSTSTSAHREFKARTAADRVCS